MTRESEHSLLTRFQRFCAPFSIGGAETSNQGIPFSGRIFLITTWTPGKGEEDFYHIVSRKNHKIRDVIRINWYRNKDHALEIAIRENSDKLQTGDIVAIVRGGGDTSDTQFRPFKYPGGVEAIRQLREQRGVTVITGLGHSSDYFPVEAAATFRQATPTDAAYKVCKLLQVTD